MFRSTFIPRSLVVFGLCLPLAILLGYLLATPFAFSSYATVSLILAVLTFPLLLRWHHPLLIFTWNSYFIVSVLPGQPGLVFVFAACSFGISLLQQTLRREGTFFPVPALSYSLILLGLVVVITAKLTGGIGGRAFGQDVWGAKRYLGVIGAILGYFALVAQKISRERAVPYARIHILSGATALFSDLIYAVGPSLYFLFAVFSPMVAGAQALSQDAIPRLSGVGFGAQSAGFFMLMRYGIRGICDLTKPWRLILFIGFFLASLLGGYRSMIVLGLLLFFCQFWFERLYKGRALIVLLTATVLLSCGLIAFSERLPLSVQRSLSFLPLNVDPAAKLDAESTLEWRMQIWKIVVPEIPQYLLVGKGYAYSGTDSMLAAEGIRRGLFASYEEALISGSYHQGVLTVLIPFGFFGLAAFAWFCGAGLRVLYRNYLYGEEHLRAVNTFLISYFVGRLIFYVVFYGNFDYDLMIFTGTVGLSIALNGGVRKADAGHGTAIAPLETQALQS